MIDPIHPDFENTPISGKRPSFEYSPSDVSTKPAATIITPFYNTGAVFHETAQSIIRQSFQQWEWLIINDGSRDPASLDILRQYRQCDPRIKVIDHSENRGPSAARNTGFARAGSEYVLQLDSDDMIEPTTVEKWLWFMHSHPEYAFVNGYQVAFGQKTYLWKRGFHDGKVILHENVIDNTWMIRRSVYSAVKGHDEEIVDGLEDWDFWLRCADKGYWGNTINEYFKWYRIRPNHTDRWSNWQESRISGFLISERRKYPDLWRRKFPHVDGSKEASRNPISADVPFSNRLKKNKRRLLLVLPWLTPGGADKYNIDLIRLMTERGWEITIATSKRSTDQWIHEFSRVTPDIFMLHRFLKFCDYPRFLRYLINSRKPDVVAISNSEFGYLIAPFLRAYCHEPAYIDIIHSEDTTWLDGGYPAISIKAKEQLDLSIVVSRYLKNWMVSRGGDDRRIEVCYVNVDPSFWIADDALRNKTRSELHIRGTVPVILYPARLSIEKQPMVFARVMRRLKKEGFEFFAVVAGDGDERKWLERYIRVHRLSSVIKMLGNISPSKMKEVMNACDILFLPSQREGISLAIYEAMSCGLCVVSADVGGQKELVVSETGILLPRGSQEEEINNYSKVLAVLLRNQRARQELGANARKRIVKHFTLEHMGNRMVELFGRAIELKKTEPRPMMTHEQGLHEAEKAIAYLRLMGGEKAGPSYLRMSTGSYIYHYIGRLFGFIYMFGIRKGWSWIIPLKSRIRRLLKVGEEP